jgi:phosphate-selective porin OprO and OprP
MKHIVLLSLAICGALSLCAQQEAGTAFGNGVRFTPADSSYSVKFILRMQSQYEGTLNVHTGTYSDVFQIRRAHLKFTGFIYDPSLEYKFELALANAEMEDTDVPQSGNVSSLILDAYVAWNFLRGWTVVLGQKKLPGDRASVISSQYIQFVDRSNVSDQFSIDRGPGIQLRFRRDHFNVTGALTMGEGRNIIVENIGGYDYTLRAEYLPLGKFRHDGDYFETDFEREPKPKLSVGAACDFNDGASREAGQSGDFFNTTRDLVSAFLDAHFKYRGFSSEAQYAQRKTHGTPVLYDSAGNFANAYITGTGFNWQAGYLFKNDVEVAARYSVVTPEADRQRYDNTQYTVAVSKYVKRHFLKLQSDLSLIREMPVANTLTYRLKLEFSL